GRAGEDGEGSGGQDRGGFWERAGRVHAPSARGRPGARSGLRDRRRHLVRGVLDVEVGVARKPLLVAAGEARPLLAGGRGGCSPNAPARSGGGPAPTPRR